MNGYRKRDDTGQNGHHQKVYKQQIWPSNPTAGRHPEVTDTCTPTFTAALFTIARTRKQPRCPLADERIRQLWYIYNGILLKYKKERAWVSSNEVDEPGAYYTEWSKSEREREILYINAYRWNLERRNQWPYMQGSKEDTDVKNRLLDYMGKGKGGIIWENGIETCTLHM